MEVVIKPERTLKTEWRELWRYRELFYFLAWRDVKIRYKQTIIGASWAIFQPFVLMIVFTVFFNRVLNVNSGGVPYPIFVYSGLLFWNYFSQTLSRASESLVGNQAIITKVYFPRIIAPLSTPVVAFIDFLFALVVFAVLMIWYGIVPSLAGVLLFLPMVGVAFLAASGLGLFLAALNVKYRDVRQALPFFIQTLLFLTPVIYPVSVVPQRFQWLLYFNPMAGVIAVMRAGLIHDGSPRWGLVALSVGVAVALAIAGIQYFERRERAIADII
jgi:lipopolysaccharide transport system permease protein